MKAKTKPFNIVIYPPAEISKRAITVSKKLRNRNALFVLDGKNYFPHITLYMTEFPLKNVAKIRKLLKQFAVKTKPFEISSSKYRQNTDGYIDVDYKKSKNINELQKKIIKLLNPLREGQMREKDKARISAMTKTEQKNLKLYGYRGVGAKFFPHLTFTKLEKFDKSVLSNIDKSNFSFKVNKIGFFYLGNYGACYKLIEIFDLS
ncbi:hypothetical protein A2242_02890 [Candidatus Falkowbacteria bacterium RIFOXYA2_FULL_47_9]|uniref:2'-5' RNA ligase n=1 Tax=Candidatus Falkowbacteria bacterium RIFOXYA2_FULL_47_9 TaxID=1797995 RepID=A0A1F5SJN9_9BACT|nr:MAG: hypothetical protein A2242_02890 [Candidatus Falkowbacteria bacterium RIFOXYA2_FULL_47_9]